MSAQEFSTNSELDTLTIHASLVSGDRVSHEEKSIWLDRVDVAFKRSMGDFAFVICEDIVELAVVGNSLEASRKRVELE